MIEWKQLDLQCPNCKSFYVIKKGKIWICNKCESERVLIKQKKIKYKIRKHIGKTWSKKRHRYLTSKEIKEEKI